MSVSTARKLTVNCRQGGRRWTSTSTQAALATPCTSATRNGGGLRGPAPFKRWMLCLVHHQILLVCPMEAHRLTVAARLPTQLPAVIPTQASQVQALPTRARVPALELELELELVPTRVFVNLATLMTTMKQVEPAMVATVTVTVATATVTTPAPAPAPPPVVATSLAVPQNTVVALIARLALVGATAGRLRRQPTLLMSEAPRHHPGLCQRTCCHRVPHAAQAAATHNQPAESRLRCCAQR